MAGVAQLVRAPDCGSGGRRFDPGRSPHLSSQFFFVHKLASKQIKMIGSLSPPSNYSQEQSDLTEELKLYIPLIPITETNDIAAMGPQD